MPLVEESVRSLLSLMCAADDLRERDASETDESEPPPPGLVTVFINDLEFWTDRSPDPVHELLKKIQGK